MRVSPESQKSIIVNISFDGESGSGCWPAALLSFGTELPTSGLCQHSLTVFVHTQVCVCVSACVLGSLHQPQSCQALDGEQIC